MSIIGPLFKWLLLALWEMKEKSHEAIEVDSDPDVARRFFNGKRL